METLYIPNETDFKRWIKEAVNEYFQERCYPSVAADGKEESLIGRKEVAKLLKVSLVTLTDWMKRGLPFHKHRGRVYFSQTEVLEYIKQQRLPQKMWQMKAIENLKVSS